jgi:hypothetical protein
MDEDMASREFYWKLAEREYWRGIRRGFFGGAVLAIIVTVAVIDLWGR